MRDTKLQRPVLSLFAAFVPAVTLHTAEAGAQAQLPYFRRGIVGNNLATGGMKVMVS